MPFSLGASRIAALISAILVVQYSFDEARRIRFPLTAWLWAAFFLLAIPVTYLGIDPDTGVRKLDKLAWFFIIPLSATLVNSERRQTDVLLALAVGMVVLTLRQWVSAPLEAWNLVRTEVVETWMDGMIKIGSMTHAQRFVVGILLAVAWVTSACTQVRSRRWFMALLLLCGTGLLMSFKRGSWMCAIIAAGALLVGRAGRKGFLLLVLAVLSLWFVPPVRSRLEGLRDEFQEGRGGRMYMWTQLAPAMARDYPEGIGWYSMSSDFMREYGPDVEPNRNHLHSNLFQIRVEMGWLGFAFYVAWMSKALLDALGFLVFARGPDQRAARFILFALFALMLNGLVEYNFGDGEIVLLYGLLMGCAAAGLRRSIAFETNTGIPAAAPG